MKVKVYETADDAIHAVVMDGGEIRNIVSGFEDEDISRNAFIAAARSGFAGAGDYAPDGHSGMDMAQAVQHLETMGRLIAEITEDSVDMYPGKMGLAGHILFEIGQFI